MLTLDPSALAKLNAMNPFNLPSLSAVTNDGQVTQKLFSGFQGDSADAADHVGYATYNVGAKPGTADDTYNRYDSSGIFTNVGKMKKIEPLGVGLATWAITAYSLGTVGSAINAASTAGIGAAPTAGIGHGAFLGEAAWAPTAAAAAPGSGLTFASVAGAVKTGAGIVGTLSTLAGDAGGGGSSGGSSGGVSGIAPSTSGSAPQTLVLTGGGGSSTPALQQTQAPVMAQGGGTSIETRNEGFSFSTFLPGLVILGGLLFLGAKA